MHEKRAGSLTHFVPPQLHSQFFAEEFLSHLHILAHSGLVFPLTEIVKLQTLVDQSRQIPVTPPPREHALYDRNGELVNREF
jgi:hypothetical protein